MNLGDNLDETFRKGIASSGSYLLLLSREALESQWVNIEMELALENKQERPNFKIQVVRLDDAPVPPRLRKFHYQRWQAEDEPGSVLKLIASLTGKDIFTGITGQSFLTGVPSLAIPNELGTIAEHSRNYVF